MSRLLTGFDAWLSSGAALYWASIALRYMGMGPVPSGALGSLRGPVQYLSMLVWIGLSCLALSRLGIGRARRALGVSSAAASLAVLVAALLGTGSTSDAAGAAAVSPIWEAALLAADFFTVSAAMVLWGMAFASIEKYLAAENVVVTVMLGSLLVLAGELVLARFSQVPLAGALTVASSLIMAFGPIAIRNQARRAAGEVPGGGMHGARRHAPEQERRDRGSGPRFAIFARRAWPLAGLLCQRLAFGVALGFLPTALAVQGSLGADHALVALSIGVLVCCIAVALRVSVPVYTMLPALLLVAFGALCIPSLAAGMPAAGLAFVGAIWFSWQSLSSVQLSEVKERLAASELATTALDKVAIDVSFIVGSLLALVVGAVGPGVALAAACLLALLSTFVVALMVGVRQQDAARDEAAQAEARRQAELYDRLARRLDLSAREREVVEMLARGYSSAFIAEQLGVSQSTAKSHIAHIYQKAGVHRKDEFLELIDS